MLESCKTTVDTIANGVENLDVRVTALELENTGSVGQGAAIIEDIAEIKTIVDAENVKLDNLKTSIDTNSTTLTAVRTDVANTTSAVDGVYNIVEEVQEAVDNVNYNIGTANTNINTVKTTTNTINSTLNTVNTNVNTANTNINTIKSTTSTINTNLNHANTDLDSIITKINALQTAVTNLNTAVANSGGSRMVSASVEIEDGKNVTVPRTIDIVNSIYIEYGTNGTYNFIPNKVSWGVDNNTSLLYIVSNPAPTDTTYTIHGNSDGILYYNYWE